MAKVVPLKLDPTPFSSKERDRSEGLLDWDKLLRSPAEFLPLRRTIVNLTCWNTHQLLLNPAIHENAILPTQCLTFLKPPCSLHSYKRREDPILLPAGEQRWPDVTPQESGTQPVQGLLLGC